MEICQSSPVVLSQVDFQVYSQAWKKLQSSAKQRDLQVGWVSSQIRDGGFVLCVFLHNRLSSEDLINHFAL